MDHLLLAFFWILYGVLHSLFASQQIKLQFSHILGNKFRFYRIFYNLFALAALVLLMYFQLSLSTIRLFYGSGWQAAGILLCLLGTVIMLVCIRKYIGEGSGIRSLWKEEEKQSLHRSGLHRYVRHPLYLGTFIFIWGLFLVFPFLSLLVMNVVVTIYTLVGIRLEEEKLVLAFGNMYRDYRREVPMILPFFLNKRKKLQPPPEKGISPN